MARSVSLGAQAPRPVADKATDASALRAIAQAAVNVELFTIPLYMGTLYSVQGTHQITGSNSFYQGRKWPGPAPTAVPTTANEKAFNLIFSVFVEEMLHLQLASNIATAIGVTPTFTSPALQDQRHGWTCYGKDKTVIPHIVDLQHTVNFSDVKVDIAELSAEQLRLFLAIELPEHLAQAEVQPVIEKYHPTVPFDGWKEDDKETDLPLFGTIGWMYQCYFDYLNLRYEDGTSLWDFVFAAESLQNDMFNEVTPGHPAREYPGFDATVTSAAFDKVVDMMNAITDQGEGSVLETAPEGLLQEVSLPYQASRAALEQDYPDYDDTGHPVPPPNQSAAAEARAGAHTIGMDHYEHFSDLATYVADVETWPAWFKRVGQWTAEDLQTPSYDPDNNPYGLPTTAVIAAALNEMGDRSDPEVRAANFAKISQAAIGSIAGITTVLDTYWSKPGTPFPYPSMVGSGDRMSICWAVFGEAPNLALGIDPILPGTLYHSCQGLDFEGGRGTNDCAAVEVFHACRGSNNCRAQGGCGFVQPTKGGGQCGSTALAAKNLCGNPVSGDLFSAPSDNRCGGFGGCATPISASQIFPTFKDSKGDPATQGTMQLFDFPPPDHRSTTGATMPFESGEKVHDVAYKAFLTVVASRTDPPTPPPTPPPPNTLRLVFPPST